MLISLAFFFGKDFASSITKGGHMEHIFEQAGLGKAPFKLVGYSYETFKPAIDCPAKPGGSCAYCGQAISHMYHIESADGKKFHVGCECVNKTGDKGLVKEMKAQVRKNNANKRAEKSVSVKAEIEALLTSFDFSQYPHPNTYMSQKGLTFRDYIGWMLDHSLNSGRVKLLKTMKSLMSEGK